jgi:hypothetical protein
MECGPLPLVGRADCSSRKQHREDGDRLCPRNIEHFHTLTQLSAQEDFTEFCRRESLKTYISTVSVSRFLNLYLRLQDIVVIFHIRQTQQTTRDSYSHCYKRTLHRLTEYIKVFSIYQFSESSCLAIHFKLNMFSFNSEAKIWREKWLRSEHEMWSFVTSMVDFITSDLRLPNILYYPTHPYDIPLIISILAECTYTLILLLLLCLPVCLNIVFNEFKIHCSVCLTNMYFFKQDFHTVLCYLYYRTTINRSDITFVLIVHFHLIFYLFCSRF